MIKRFNNFGEVGKIYDSLFLFCLLFPAGFGFFSILLALSPSNIVKTNTISAGASVIFALTANRIGRMISAAIATIPKWQHKEGILSGVMQILGFVFLFLALQNNYPLLFFVTSAACFGFALTSGNVFFRTLLTTGASHINHKNYSILFYSFWGIGIAFAGLIWEHPLRIFFIAIIMSISAISCWIAIKITPPKIKSENKEQQIFFWRKKTRELAHSGLISTPAVISACVAILFNAALVPLLTVNLGFTTAQTGIAACFIVFGNILASLDGKVKLANLNPFYGILISLAGNILLVLLLFLLRDAWIMALFVIVGIGIFSSWNLKFQMAFVQNLARTDSHRLIHAMSEILAVIGGLGLGVLSSHGMHTNIQFLLIGAVLVLWWGIMVSKFTPEELAKIS